MAAITPIARKVLPAHGKPSEYCNPATTKEKRINPQIANLDARVMPPPLSRSVGTGKLSALVSSCVGKINPAIFPQL